MNLSATKPTGAYTEVSKSKQHEDYYAPLLCVKH